MARSRTKNTETRRRATNVQPTALPLPASLHARHVDPLRSRAILPRRHRAYPIVVAFALVVMLLREISVITTLSHTFDEPYHIGASVVLYESRKLATGAQHPPLPRLVVGAVLMAQGVTLPEARDTDPNRRTPITEYLAFGIGHDLIFSGQLSYWRMLITARLALLIFPVLTMLFTYRLGRWLGSPAIGVAAV